MNTQSTWISCGKRNAPAQSKQSTAAGRHEAKMDKLNQTFGEVALGLHRQAEGNVRPIDALAEHACRIRRPAFAGH